MARLDHKKDGAKPAFAWLPWRALDEVASVVTWAVNAKGYPPRGYLELPDGAERYASAACRHLSAYFEGQWLDEESGKPVLAHAAADLLFVLAIELRDRARSPSTVVNLTNGKTDAR